MKTSKRVHDCGSVDFPAHQSLRAHLTNTVPTLANFRQLHDTMVTPVVTMRNFDDLPIAQTLAKMSLESSRKETTTSSRDAISAEEKEEDGKEQRKRSRLDVKVGLQIPPAGVPGRSILKPSEPYSSNNTADTSRSGNNEKKREVSFHSIQIRHYQMVLGDNPACSIGAPVQLDWDYDFEEKHDLDIYEVERRPRRRLRHLVLSYYRRKDILLNAGFDENEMRSVERQLAKLKRQRKTTGFFLPIQKMEEVVQSAGRKVRRAAGGKKKEDQ